MNESSKRLLLLSMSFCLGINDLNLRLVGFLWFPNCNFKLIQRAFLVLVICFARFCKDIFLISEICFVTHLIFLFNDRRLVAFQSCVILQQFFRRKTIPHQFLLSLTLQSFLLFSFFMRQRLLLLFSSQHCSHLFLRFGRVERKCFTFFGQLFR